MKNYFISNVLAMIFAVSILTPAMAQNQKVEVYCDNNYAPYSFAENGEAAGIYADIFKKAFSRINGYSVTIKPVPWKRGINLMKQGKGFALYPPYYRPKVRPFMDYPVSVLEEGYDIICGDDIAKTDRKIWPDDFKGLKIGFNAGFSIPHMEKAKIMGIKFDEQGDTRSNLLKLAAGRLDGYINDKNASLWQLKRLKENGEYKKDTHKRLVITTNISIEHSYIGITNMDKGKYTFKDDFVKQLVEVINRMKGNGEIQKILASYIK